MLEALDARDVPAAFTWTGAVSDSALDPDNWASAEEQGQLPADGDDVYFGVVSGVYHNCVDLASDLGAFNSLTLAAEYDGTVFVAQDSYLATADFTLAGGAIAQPSPYPTPIEVNEGTPT